MRGSDSKLFGICRVSGIGSSRACQHLLHRCTPRADVSTTAVEPELAASHPAPLRGHSKCKTRTKCRHTKHFSSVRHDAWLRQGLQLHARPHDARDHDSEPLAGQKRSSSPNWPKNLGSHHGSGPGAATWAFASEPCRGSVVQCTPDPYTRTNIPCWAPLTPASQLHPQDPSQTS